jgi:DNA topoisomerase-1
MYNIPVKKTMEIAQNLYNAGYITYMRTDSVNLSDEALEMTKQYVIKTYGEKYYRLKQYVSKGKFTQEAHEAIRPTDINTVYIEQNASAKIGISEIKLYELIRNRTIASQMQPAIYNITHINIIINDKVISQYYLLLKNET